jgi:hypothetical protein
MCSTISGIPESKKMHLLRISDENKCLKTHLLEARGNLEEVPFFCNIQQLQALQAL